MKLIPQMDSFSANCQHKMEEGEAGVNKKIKQEDYSNM